MYLFKKLEKLKSKRKLLLQESLPSKEVLKDFLNLFTDVSNEEFEKKLKDLKKMYDIEISNLENETNKNQLKLL